MLLGTREALITKILKSNEQFVCQLTLRHLNDDELNCLTHAKTCKAFDASVYEAIGLAATKNDIPAEDLTPDYEAYNENILAFDPDFGNIEVMLETGDTFVGAEILLPCGGTMTKGRVTAQKRDADGNLKGAENDIPILDTREYVVTFDNGDMTKLNANLIAQSMYAQCDPDSNQYLLLDSIIDYQCLDIAIRLTDQIVV